MMRRARNSAPALLMLAAASAHAQEGLRAEDGVRLAEAFRLAAAAQENVWAGWGEAPFSVLLVAGEREFLVGTRTAPEGFLRSDDPAGSWGAVWSRPRTSDPGLLATFPALDATPTIVIGQAEATGKTSTAWVLTVLHEHFHQLQMSWPDYYETTTALGLSGSDRTGMWMLDYPFPYDSPEVGREFAALARRLAEALEKPSARKRNRFWREYARLLGGLAEKDGRYLRFQVWQEGVARYVELRAAEAASRGYAPSAEFQALPDYRPYGEIAPRMRDDLSSQLRRIDLAARRRVCFYAFGAGIALLLDQDGDSWKAVYFDGTFRLERR